MHQILKYIKDLCIEMIKSEYIATVPFLAESLKRDILKEHDLDWTEFLILSLLNQFEQKDIHPSPQKIITALGMSRCWIYKAIKRLAEQGHIFFSEGKPFEPGRLFIAPLGEYSLRRINTNLARKVRELRKEMNSLICAEDSV